jgi:hypothetical protein
MALLWKQCAVNNCSFWLPFHGVSAVGFLPDGKTAFSAGKDKMVRSGI